MCESAWLRTGFRLTTAILAALLLLHPRAGSCADGDSHRKLLELVKPQYPELAKQMRVTGAIVLRITILPNGQVTEVQFEKGHPLLLRAAEEAVRRWRFAAAPDTTTQNVQVTFELPH